MWLLLWGGAVGAQSEAALDAVRLHRPDARAAVDAQWQACAVASCSQLGRLSLLSGYLALAEGDAAAALTRLTPGPIEPGLEPYRLFYRSEAQFYTRDYAGAAGGFVAGMLHAPASLEVRARARAGESWLRAGDAAQARPLLERAVTAMATPELLYERAEARTLTGDVPGALGDLRALALRFPNHPYADVALSRLGQGPAPVPFTFDEWLSRIRGLLDGGNPTRVLAELVAVDAAKLGRGVSAQAREALLRAQALFALGREAEADHEVERALHGQRPVAAEAAMLRAKRVMRGADTVKAGEQMAWVDRKFLGEPAADEAGYFVGWLDLQGGRFAQAVKGFDSFEKRHPGSHRRDEALWFKALAQIRLGRYPEATRTLDALASQFPRSSLLPQARYWSARCLQLGGAPPEPVAARYQELIHTFAGHYYALLAATRLIEAGHTPASPFPAPPLDRKIPIPPKLKLAAALAETGLIRDANDEVFAQASAVHSADEALEDGLALQSLGEFGGAYALGARLLWGAAYTDRKPEALALLYPRAFRAAVESEAKARSFDPFFVWAIMRRESAFRPEVVSAANARGLLQLLPATSDGIARQLKEPAPHPDELYSPTVNIRLATWYLAALFARFGHPILAAAAYNAGPVPTVKWVQDNGTLPLDLFVELIPYKETRGYVKQVSADYFTYHLLYGAPEQAPALALALPGAPDAGVNF